MSQYKGSRRTRSAAYRQTAKRTALVAVAAFTVAAGSAWATSNISDPNIVSISAASESLPVSQFRNIGSFTSRSQHRLELPMQNMVEVTLAASIQDGFDGPDQWQRQQDFLDARATATAETARVAKTQAAARAARAKAAAKAARAKAAAKVARATRAARDVRKARTRAAQIDAVEAAVDAKRARVARLNRTGSGPSSPAIAAARAWAAAELTRMGYEPEQFTCLDQLWTRESGWNLRADNPTSTAYGIPQALPGSKMASAGADWRTNPRTQIAWGLRYIKTRYENPCRAWAKSERDNWY